MRKFDQRYPNARTTSDKASWPRGVRKISQIGLDNIGIDNEGRLYWSGHMVKEANPLELTHQQEVSAIIAVVSGVVLALSTLALAVVDTVRLLGYGPLFLSAYNQATFAVTRASRMPNRRRPTPTLAPNWRLMRRAHVRFGSVC
jgi:hypothetical protein